MRNKTAKLLRKYSVFSKIEYKKVKKVYKFLDTVAREKFNYSIRKVMEINDSI